MRRISFLVAALFVAILCVSSRPAVADAIVTVKAPTSVALGSSLAVDINIANVSDLYGFQFDLSFDPAVLSATSGTEGALLPGGGPTVFIPGSVDNTAGLVTATADTLQGAIPGASGSGTLVVFDFTSLAAGTSNLGILNVTLLDSSLSPIPETTVGGSVTVGSTASVPEPSSLFQLLIGACTLTICFCSRPALSLRARGAGRVGIAHLV